MYFNPAAFARIPQYTFGNVGRNTMRGPEAFSWDFSTVKNLALPREGHQLQFRFEAYNLPNRPNFGNPSANLAPASVGSFGKLLTTIGDPRDIQFALKLYF